MGNKYQLGDSVVGNDSRGIKSGKIIKITNCVIGIGAKKILYKIETKSKETPLYWEYELSDVDPEKIKERNLIRESMMSTDPYLEENW